MILKEYKLRLADAIPQRASTGWLMKWNIGNRWIKSPGLSDGYMWESFAEVIASTIARDIGIQRCLKYDLCIINVDDIRIIGCISNDFKNTLTEVNMLKMINMKHIRDFRFRGLEGFNNLINDIENSFNINITSYLEDVIVLDSIILNTDRNAWNLSILIDNHNKASECKIYDNGSSLGLDRYSCGEFYNDIIYTNGIIAKPFDMKFENQLKYIRKCRKYHFNNLENTYNLLKYIKYNFCDNNTFNVANTLDIGQYQYIESLIKTRINVTRDILCC